VTGEPQMAEPRERPSIGSKLMEKLDHRGAKISPKRWWVEAQQAAEPT